MIKSLLISIFLLATALSANASEQIIRFDDFVHMSFEQQVKTIDLVHDYLIEFENQRLLKQATTTSDKKKYQSSIKILNFFLNTAYADSSEMPDGSELCYYGGWISMTRNNRCMHPDHINWPEFKKTKNNLDPKLKDYLSKVGDKYFGAKNTKAKKLTFKDGKFSLSESKSSCYKDKEIICNQDIYGSDDGAPFCVSGNSNYGFNTSFLCNQALEVIKKEDKSKHEKIMGEIVQKGLDSSSSNQFFYTLRSMYDICLCGGADQKYFSNTVSPSFAKRMFPTRTCYGILNQTQDIFNSINASGDLACKTLEQKEFISSHTANWSQFLNKAHKQISKELSEYENLSSIDFLKSQMNAQEVQKAQENDQGGAFGKIRNSNMNSYVEEGLCPLKDFMPIKPSLVLTKEEKGDKTIFTTKVLDLPKDSKVEGYKVNLPNPDITSPKLVVSPDDPTTATFEMPHSETTQDIEVEVDVDKDKLKAKGDVPALDKIPTLNLDYDSNSNKVTATIENVTDENKETITWVDVKTQEEGAPKPELLENNTIEKNIKEIKVEQFEEPYTITITAKAKDSAGNEVELVQTQQIPAKDAGPEIKLTYDSETKTAKAELQNIPEGAKITDFTLTPVDSANAGALEEILPAGENDPNMKEYNVTPQEADFDIIASAKVDDKEIKSEPQTISKTETAVKLAVSRGEGNILIGKITGLEEDQKEGIVWQAPKIIKPVEGGSAKINEAGEDLLSQEYEYTPTAEDFEIEISAKLADGTDLVSEPLTIGAVENTASNESACSISVEEDTSKTPVQIIAKLTIDNKEYTTPPDGYTVTRYKESTTGSTDSAPESERDKRTTDNLDESDEDSDEDTEKELSDTEKLVESQSVVPDSEAGVPGVTYTYVLENEEKGCLAHTQYTREAPEVKPTPRDPGFVYPYKRVPTSAPRQRRGHLIRGTI